MREASFMGIWKLVAGSLPKFLAADGTATLRVKSLSLGWSFVGSVSFLKLPSSRGLSRRI